ncbi:YciI family protein [Cohaesibacter gelatinilyticus]|uniref:Uncharacterized conserved protein YciI, contains a putative active-site phosphohistidine n=1 Tax=Cohaesibacter gelatinilyticus TaxID=372072 RepID=A0A285NC11_9HYPH|nr:YciI family protein [Cohaesibacter gelatinilyticus]SNZ06980.1 Uncharacterized conserved protein YciI, contains a putative active-site phosphohistidine [Cohaesibacter gelatinilyticus]
MPLIEKDANLFTIDLNYIVPIEQVEPHISAHMDFLQRNYDQKRFLASGPKVPRTGGMIIAVGSSRQEIENLIKEDPFHIHALAAYEITEFVPRMKADGDL